MRIFLSAGEPSGDHHAALLVRELRERDANLEIVGLGGPCMAAEGCQLVADMTRLAVMWFVRVIFSIHRFVDLARRAERRFLDAKPDVCVLVDFPGFHWWLAWRAKRHGIPVVFYCPPQVWAWASWRIKKMKRLVDHVLSALPFEHEWFMAQGVQSAYVGHPFFDEHESDRCVSDRDREKPLVVLLPGSRGQEIEANLTSILRAAAAVKKRVPSVELTVAALHDRHAAKVREVIATSAEANGLGIVVESGKARELIGRATAAIAVSGSVSLELLAARVPTVILYRISSFAYVIQSFFRHAKFITLVNLLACREPIGPCRPVLRAPAGVLSADPEAVFPEFLTVVDPAEPVAAHVIEWLENPAALAGTRTRIEQVADRVASPGSAGRAAEAVLAIAGRRECNNVAAGPASRAA